MTRRADMFGLVRAANPVPDAVEPDWDAVRERALGEQDGDLASGAPHAGGRRARRSLRIAGVLAGLALCAGAATVAVFALAPSAGAPDFLARAAAALAPTSGTVLYERWERTMGPEPGNPERRGSVSFGPEQLWIQADHPRRYRTVLAPRSGPVQRRPGGVALAYLYGVVLDYAGSGPGRVDSLTRLQRAITGQPLELGGTVEAAGETSNSGGASPTLTFLPARELMRARLHVTLGALLPGPGYQAIENGTDPVATLRAAILEGRARVAGSTRFRGRTVQRIDIRLPQQLPADAPLLPAGHPRTRAEAFALVEPKTFHPVEIVYGGQTDRFLTYEYLPATAANLALTDIRAQHPGARILNTIKAPARPGRRPE